MIICGLFVYIGTMHFLCVLRGKRSSHFLSFCFLLKYKIWDYHWHSTQTMKSQKFLVSENVQLFIYWNPSICFYYQFSLPFSLSFLLKHCNNFYFVKQIITRTNSWTVQRQKLLQSVIKLIICLYGFHGRYIRVTYILYFFLFIVRVEFLQSIVNTLNA